jgi:beta-glucanase (GH16 family)
MLFIVNKRNKSPLSMIAILLITIFTFSGCLENNSIVERNWELTWEDEFDGLAGESVNTNNWVFDLGRGPNEDGWGNAELQTYTNAPENISYDGEGNLAITARNDGGFSSARITTKGLFEQAYGRFEARIKMPYGPGIWPAFWLLGADIDENPWPNCGEIDVVEMKGYEPNLIHGSVHGPGYSGGSPITKTFGFENDRFDVDFYVYRIDWGEDYINYYVDDILYQQITPDDVPGEWVFDNPFYMLLNLAVGGNYVGFPTPSTNFPQTMLVDYVRVYKEIK